MFYNIKNSFSSEPITTASSNVSHNLITKYDVRFFFYIWPSNGYAWIFEVCFAEIFRYAFELTTEFRKNNIGLNILIIWFIWNNIVPPHQGSIKAIVYSYILLCIKCRNTRLLAATLLLCYSILAFFVVSDILPLFDISATIRFNYLSYHEYNTVKSLQRFVWRKEYMYTTSHPVNKWFYLLFYFLEVLNMTQFNNEYYHIKHVTGFFIKFYFN